MVRIFWHVPDSHVKYALLLEPKPQVKFDLKAQLLGVELSLKVAPKLVNYILEVSSGHFFDLKLAEPPVKPHAMDAAGHVEYTVASHVHNLLRQHGAEPPQKKPVDAAPDKAADKEEEEEKEGEEEAAPKVHTAPHMLHHPDHHLHNEHDDDHGESDGEEHDIHCKARLATVQDILKKDGYEDEKPPPPPPPPDTAAPRDADAKSERRRSSFFGFGRKDAQEEEHAAGGGVGEQQDGPPQERRSSIDKVKSGVGKVTRPLADSLGCASQR